MEILYRATLGILLHILIVSLLNFFMSMVGILKALGICMEYTVGN